MTTQHNTTQQNHNQQKTVFECILEWSLSRLSGNVTLSAGSLQKDGLLVVAWTYEFLHSIAFRTPVPRPINWILRIAPSSFHRKWCRCRWNVLTTEHSLMDREQHITPPNPKDEVLRKIGRNLLIFQQIEGLLKISSKPLKWCVSNAIGWFIISCHIGNPILLKICSKPVTIPDILSNP